MFVSKLWIDDVKYRLDKAETKTLSNECFSDQLRRDLEKDIHRNSETLIRLAETVERTLNKLNALAKHFNLQITYPGGIPKVDSAPVECFLCSKCDTMFPVCGYWSTETFKDRLCDRCKSLAKAEPNKGGTSK